MEADEQGRKGMSAVGRRRTATVLIVVATLAGFLMMGSLWVKRQVLDTERWVEASGELLEDEDIRDAVASYLTDQLFASGTIQAEVTNALPPQLQPLAGPATGALQQAVQRLAEELLSRPKVQDLWEEANRLAQSQLVALITDQPVASNALSAASDKLSGSSLDLSKIREALETRLGVTLPTNAQGKGAAQAAIEQQDATAAIQILAPDQLKTAQDIGGIVRHLPYILLALTLILYAAAIYVSDRRRGALMGCGLSLILVGVSAIALRSVAGDAVVDALAASPSIKPAALSAWVIATSLLRTMAVAAIMYGAVVLAGAWLAGPSRPATKLRSWAAPYTATWVIPYATLLLVFLLLVAWGPTPALREPFFAFLILILLGIGVEALRRQIRREHPEAGADAV